MHLPPLPFEARPVRRIIRLSAEELLTYAFDEPVVLTGCMDDWKLYRELQAAPTYEQKMAVLGSLIGERPVTFHRLPREHKGQFHFQPDNLERLTFGKSTKQAEVPFDAFASQALGSLRGASEDYVYMQAHYIPPATPLFNALGPNVLSFLREDQVHATLWVGSNGQVVNLHYDDFLTFICMADGVKRVTLFSPDLLPYIYQAPFDRMIECAQVSLVRLLELDLKRYPLFAEALKDARVVDLQPGEVLLVPPMWWHHVESFGLNVMVNNRVFFASFEHFEEVYANLTHAVRLFVHVPAERRARAMALYQQTLFAPGGVVEPGPSHAAALAEETPEQARHRATTRKLAASLPEFLRKHLARYYSHFVFQASGDPHPSLPGAFAAMVERNANAPTFFPRD
jgi:Cupin-like domain